MIDNDLALLSLRNRALALSVCTTGAVSLAATAAGFTRAAGSFITDGFRVGMEFLSAGFGNSLNNGTGVITSVTAGELDVSMFVVSSSGGVQSVARHATVTDAAASGRTISVGLPSMRAWELIEFTPAAGIPYVEEEYVAATNQLYTAPANGGHLEETGLYILKWYGVSGVGSSALRKSVDALKALFAPGTNMSSGGQTVTVRGDFAPYTGQILPLVGKAVLVLTIPWRAFSTNAIAA